MAANQPLPELPLPKQPSNTGSTSRSYRACIWCRQHKRKCDGLEPCTTCALSTEKRKCEYAPPKKRGRKIKRLYDDKLSIEHVIKKRQESGGGEHPSSYSESAEFTPLRLPETLSLENLSSSLSPHSTTVHSPMDSPPLRYPDSLTAPDRYNYSSKYTLRGRESSESLSLKLPQIRAGSNPAVAEDMAWQAGSFSHPSLQSSSSSSASVSELGGPMSKHWKGSDSDFFESNEPDSLSSHSLPLLSQSQSQSNILSPPLPIISPSHSQPTILSLHTQSNILSPPNIPIISPSHTQSPLLPLHMQSLHSQSNLLPPPNIPITSPSHSQSPVLPIHSQSLHSQSNILPPPNIHISHSQPILPLHREHMLPLHTQSNILSHSNLPIMPPTHSQSSNLPLHSQSNILSLPNIPIISSTHSQSPILPLHTQSNILSHPNLPIISPSHSQSSLLPLHSQSSRPLIPIIPQLSHTYIQQPLNKEEEKFLEFSVKEEDFVNPAQENIKRSEIIPKKEKHKSEKKGDI